MQGCLRDDIKGRVRVTYRSDAGKCFNPWKSSVSVDGAVTAAFKGLSENSRPMGNKETVIKISRFLIQQQFYRAAESQGCQSPQHNPEKLALMIIIFMIFQGGCSYWEE